MNTNEQKPVTSSRDTQEVPYEQGCEMLRIFASYQAKTSLLQGEARLPDQSQSPRGSRLIILSLFVLVRCLRGIRSPRIQTLHTIRPKEAQLLLTTIRPSASLEMRALSHSLLDFL